MIKHPISSELKESKKQMQVTIESCISFCEANNFQLISISPNSDPGSFGMKEVFNEFKKNKLFFNLETLPRNLFINLVRNTTCLIGNSSMGILEAPHYKLPVINVGNEQREG